MEEARLAIERLVLPSGGAAELLPRAPGVLVCQVLQLPLSQGKMSGVCSAFHLLHALQP